MYNLLFVIKEPTKIGIAPNMWLHSSLGSSIQLVSGRHGFKPRQSRNFFHASFCAISLIAVNLQGTICNKITNDKVDTVPVYAGLSLLLSQLA